MAAADQHVRRTASPQRSSVDASNLRRLRAIVAEHGWPGRSLIGEDGADAAWLLLQHADIPEAADFRRHCLHLLKRAVDAGEADPRHFAYVSDRIALFEGIHLRGKPGVQKFGTQVGSFTAEDGTNLEFPVVEGVEANREAYLLPPRDEVGLESRPHPIPYGEARALDVWRWPARATRPD